MTERKAAAKVKKTKRKRETGAELKGKARAEVAVFLAEAGGMWGLDKLDMHAVEDVLSIDELALEVIDIHDDGETPA